MKRILLTICVFGAFASYGFAQGCPDPIDFCTKAHGPKSSATKFCANEACFYVNCGGESEIRVVAEDESGDFPRTWFVWHKGEMAPAGTFQCELKKKQPASHGKTPVKIPDTSVKCRADLNTNGHVYHEHFVSNPATKCLGWVECKD
jgi:hypothetical protein